MATLLFNLLSQDNPFDPTDRLLYKRDRGERQADREDRRLLRQEKRGNLPESGVAGEAQLPAETLEQREAREKAEQERLASESMAKVSAKIEEIGHSNAEQIEARIKRKRDAAELTPEQVNNLDTALTELAKIEEFKGDSEVYDRMLSEFTSSHLDLILSPDEINMIQRMATQRMELREAHKEVDVNDLKAYSLLFIKDEEGVRANTSDRTLKRGATYTVDFIDPESGAINKVAQQKITLGHIMLATDINVAKVTSKKTGQTMEAHLWTNGKTYNMPEHADNKSGLKYVPIFHGDIIETKEKTAVAVDTNDNSTDALLVDIARQTDTLSTTETTQRESVTLERAIDELRRGTRVHIPDVLNGYKGVNYEEELAHMNVGDYVSTQLNELSLVQGQGASATQMWESIRRKCGRSGVVSFNEISKVVLGQKADHIIEKQTKKERQSSISLEGDAIGDYEEFRAREKVLTRMTELVTANPDISFGDMRANIQANPPSGNADLDTTRFYFYSPYGEVVTNPDGSMGMDGGTLAKPELLGRYVADVDLAIDMYSSTFLAAQNLLDAIPELSPREDVVAQRASYEKSPEVTGVVEPVIDALFPPDKEIELNRRFFDQLFHGNRTSNTQNWENPGERAVYDPEAVYERVMSANAANNKLRNRVTNVEGQTESVDLTTFATELENLRQLGFTESADDTVFKTRYLQNYNEEAGKITPEKMHRIQAGEAIDSVLGETTMELIKRGMVVDQMRDVAKEREYVKRTVIEGFDNPSTRDLLMQIADDPDVSAEQLRQYGTNIDKVHYIVIGIAKTKNSVYVEGRERPKHVEEFFGGSLSKPFQIGENAFLVPTISGNVFTYELRGTLAVSGSTRVGKRDRVEVGGSAGVSYGPAEGAFAGLRGSVSYDLDASHEWSLGVDGGVGARVGGDAPIYEQLSFAFLGFSLGRDLEGALLNDTTQLFEARESAMAEGLARLESQFDEQAGSIENAPEAQLNEMKEQLLEYYAERLKVDSIDAMRTLQFTKLRVGVSVTASGVSIPMVTGLVAFKGKTNLFYTRDAMTDLDASAQDQINELSAGADSVIELELSPGLTLSEGQTRTYDRAAGEFNPYGEYEKMAESFAQNQALNIERLGDNGEFTLGIMKLDGMAKVYADEEVGISTYPGPNGELMFSLPAGSRLSIHRVDKYYALPNGGHTQIAEIYISNNRFKALETIKASNDTHLSAEVSHRSSGSNTRFEEVRHSIHDNEASLGEVVEWDINDMREAQGLLDSAMGSQVEVNISGARQTQLRELTKSIIASGNVRFDFAANGSARSYDTMLLNQANKALELLGKEADGPKNSAEELFVLQTLLMETRASEPANIDAFINHVVGWNTRSLASHLAGDEVPDAENIAELIMLDYGRKLRRSLHNGEPMPDVPVSSGSVVQTQIGFAGHGNYMEFLNGGQNDTISLVGTVDLNETNLRAMGLSPKQAQDFLDAKGMNPLSESLFNSPAQFFEHPLTIALLEEAAKIFGPEYTTAFAEIAQTRPGSISDLSEAQKEAYDNLGHVAGQLDNVGSVYYKGRVLGLNKEAKMGFIDACRNFTTTYRAAITLGGGGAAVDVVAGAHTETGATFHELGGSVTYRETEKQGPRFKKPKSEPSGEGEGEESEAGVLGEIVDMGDGPSVGPGSGDAPDTGGGSGGPEEPNE